jgi:hypothetical protein
MLDDALGYVGMTLVFEYTHDWFSSTRLHPTLEFTRDLNVPRILPEEDEPPIRIQNSSRVKEHRSPLPKSALRPKLSQHVFHNLNHIT